MQRDPRAYLWDAREAARLAGQFIEGCDEAGFVHDPLLRPAVERQLEILGEALGQLEKVEPELAGSIPDLRSAVDLRNLLIHGYAKVDPHSIGNTLCEDLPRMADPLDALLDDRGR